MEVKVSYWVFLRIGSKVFRKISKDDVVEVLGRDKEFGLCCVVCSS